jgi:hypothetical protein
MKPPTTASLKKVSPENLTRLGAERLADILVEAADTRPELKRRLRMELAAEQGADHLALEIDKRLASLETSRSKVSWRKRASFVSDLDILRSLISERLAGLDPAMALARMWLLMDLARRLGVRVRDRDGTLGEVFAHAANDIGALLADAGDAAPAGALVEAISRDPTSWLDWLPVVLTRAPSAFAGETLRLIAEHGGTSPGWLTLARQAADAAKDVDAFQATFTPAALRTPAIAAEVGQRLLVAGRVADAGRVLEAAAPKAKGLLGGRAPPTEPDFHWESAWIDYLEISGQAAAAQEARWASFERTLSVERARAFTRRLADFQDVEAESRAFEHASAHPDFQRALQFLIEWPAFPEAARMILTRPDDVGIDPALAELWAAKLRARQPAAAHTLLRKAAAAAFKRREFKTSDRLTQEADAIDL